MLKVKGSEGFGVLALGHRVARLGFRVCVEFTVKALSFQVSSILFGDTMVPNIE